MKKGKKMVSVKVAVGEPKKYKPEDMTDKDIMEWSRKEASRDKSRTRIRSQLAEAFRKLEDQNIAVGVCKIPSGKFYTQIRQHCVGEFDPETKTDKIRKGFLGEMWFAEFWIDKKLREDEVVVLGECRTSNTKEG